MSGLISDYFYSASEIAQLRDQTRAAVEKAMAVALASGTTIHPRVVAIKASIKAGRA